MTMCVECGDETFPNCPHPDHCFLCAIEKDIPASAEPVDDAEYKKTKTWRSWPDVDGAPLGGHEVDSRWGKGA